MKKKLILSIACLLVVLSMIATSCSTGTTDVTGNTSSSDEPVYGGEITHVLSSWSASYDPLEPNGADVCTWLEPLFVPDLTTDRNDWSFQTSWTSAEYMTGLIAESWEWTSTDIITVKIKEGVYWQNKEPVNGRELTAYDVEYSFDRILGTGNGFTEASAFWGRTLSNIEKVSAVDDNTVEFKFKNPGATSVYDVLAGKVFVVTRIVAREWVEQGDTQNWENAVGTGPWMLSEMVQNTSLTYTANPDYWGNDERYPENQLPYADTLKYIVIADKSTAVAALRSDQITLIEGLSIQQRQSLEETNPEIIQGIWSGPGASLEMRCDYEPFNDIRVRKALNMAIDRELIAETLYKGTVDGKPASVITTFYKGYAYEYDEWTDELKAGYSYDPEGARELLAEAGYPDGFDTSCLTSSDSDIEIIEIMKSMFTEIGVNMEIEMMDGAALRNYTIAGNHEAMVASERMHISFSPMECVQLRDSTNANCLLHHNDEYYNNMVAGISEASTMEEAKEIIKAADKYNVEQYWSVYTCPFVNSVVWQSYLKGYDGVYFRNGIQGFLEARMWIAEDAD